MSAAVTRYALLVGVLLASAVLQGAPLPEPRAVRLGERVHVLLGPIQHANADNQGYMVNTTVILGERGAIVVDPGGSDEVGRHVAKAVRRLTPKPVTHVINTHFHGDHHLGNSAFPGATIVSSEKCRAMVSETGREWVALMEQLVGRALPGTRPIPASLTYPEDSKTAVTIDGVAVVFWVPKGAHTPGDLMVHLPRERVLVTGDVAVQGIVPVMQDGNIRNWISTLDQVLALDVDTIVPGHGGLMNREDVAALRRAMARFYAGVQAGYARGLGEREIRETLDLSAWERLERGYVIGRNVNRAYLEIENATVEGPATREAR